MAQPLQRQIIEQARDLIKDPSRWIKTEEARTIDREMWTAANPDAYAFCAYGALQHAAFRLTGAEAVDLANKAMETLAHVISPDHGYGGWDTDSIQDIVFTLNDGEGHAHILAAFDLALEQI